MTLYDHTVFSYIHSAETSILPVKKEAPVLALIMTKRGMYSHIRFVLHVSGILYTDQLLLFSGVIKSLAQHYFVHPVLRVYLIHKILLSFLRCFHRHDSP
jgi:hypothetical protein